MSPNFYEHLGRNYRWNLENQNEMFENYNFKDNRDINRLAHELRKKSQSERDNYLRGLLKINDFHAHLALLNLIKRVSPSKILLKEVLDFGLENIRFTDKGRWFKSILPIFGPVKMMKYVSKKYMNKPESIIPCLFHLAVLINKKDQKEIDAYRNLVKISMNLKPESDYYDYFKEFVNILKEKWPELLPK